MKSYGYKLINYVFSVAFYNLLPPLNQFVDAIPPKISGSGIQEFVDQFLRSSSLSKVTPLIWFDKEWKT